MEAVGAAAALAAPTPSSLGPPAVLLAAGCEVGASYAGACTIAVQMFFCCHHVSKL